MSETHDPWKDVEAELARCREIAAEWGVSPDSVQLSLTPDSLVRLLAARAAEATQHQQEIAAKDAIIKRIQNAARVLVDGADRRSEAEVKRRVAAGLSTLDSEREMNAILTNENDALRARLAAVEAERDSARDACLEWDAICKGLRAERDRLKAAIEQVAARCRLDSKKLHAVGQHDVAMENAAIAGELETMLRAALSGAEGGGK